MTVKATPDNDSGSIFLEEPIGSTNEFGGEDYSQYEASTPESRGDILTDDVVEPEEPIEDEELAPTEETEEEEGETQSPASFDPQGEYEEARKKKKQTQFDHTLLRRDVL